MRRTWCWNSTACTSRWPSGGAFEVELITQRDAILVFRAWGFNASGVFANESGGHRWQRIPPTERHGRVHTSTVTVAVLPEPAPQEVTLNDKDLEFGTTRGSGPGGQNRNKVETVVVLKHKPSGIVVRCETERSQQRNRELA